MSEQNVEQTDGGLPVQDIEGVHADPADLPEQAQFAADTEGGYAGDGSADAPDVGEQDAYRQ